MQELRDLKTKEEVVVKDPELTVEQINLLLKGIPPVDLNRDVAKELRKHFNKLVKNRLRGELVYIGKDPKLPKGIPYIKDKSSPTTK